MKNALDIKKEDLIQTEPEKAPKLYGSIGGYQWEIGKRGSGGFIIVEDFYESGYNFDVSVPKIAEFALDPHDVNHLVAAGIHDRMLELGYDTAVASAEFHRILEYRGASRLTREGAFWLTLFHTRYGLKAFAVLAMMFLWMIVWPCVALADDVRPNYTYNAKITKIYDADTMVANIDVGFKFSRNNEMLRLYAINAPEIKRSSSKGIGSAQVKHGFECRDRVLRLFGKDPSNYPRKVRYQELDPPANVVVQTFYDSNGTGKFGRTLAIVYVDTKYGQVNVNDHLVASGCSEINLYNDKVYPEGTLITRDLK